MINNQLRRQRRVLVVHGHSGRGEDICRILRREFAVDLAADISAALASTQAGAPQVVLVDATLVDSELCQGIAQLKRGGDGGATKVVLLASRNNAALNSLAAAAAADDFLLEPFGADELTARVKLQSRAIDADCPRQTMLESSADGLQLVARDGTLVHANRCGLSLMEAASEGAIAGVPMLEFIAPEHRQQWIEHHERVCMGESLRWEFEVCGLRGGRRWVESLGTPISLPGGEVAHLAALRDVGERRRAEDQRERLLAAERSARTAAEHVSHVKDEFLASLSHELRTPLNAILGYATLIRMAHMSPEELDAAVATIERNARLQAKLIDDLLEMNRLISGKIQLNAHLLDLSEPIEAAIEAIEASAEEKSIQLKKSLPRSLGVVRGDAKRIKQAAWNLLSNAVKYTPRGGTIAVELSRVGSHLEVSVTDSGVGIEPQALPHIFDLLQQSGASTTRRKGGLGFGLAIVKRIVELHGGAVLAHSPGKGQGATFVMALPLTAVVEQGAGAQTKPTATPSVQEAESSIDLSRIEVLAVDDEPDASLLVKQVLEECHASVQTASSAREALALLRQRRFHVVVSDIGMPLEDGYDLIQAVRSLDGAAADVPAIALTAFARREDRVRSDLAGFQAHLAKPFEAAELIAIVAALTGRRCTPSSSVGSPVRV